MRLRYFLSLLFLFALVQGQGYEDEEVGAGAPAAADEGKKCGDPGPPAPGPDSPCFAQEFTDDQGCPKRFIICPDPVPSGGSPAPERMTLLPDCPDTGPPPGLSPGSPCFTQEFIDNRGCPRTQIICPDPTSPPGPGKPPAPAPGCPEPRPHPGPGSACMVREFVDDRGCFIRSIACPDPTPPPGPPGKPPGGLPPAPPPEDCLPPLPDPGPDSDCMATELIDDQGCFVRTIACPPAPLECPELQPAPGPDSLCDAHEFTDENGCLVRFIACPSLPAGPERLEVAPPPPSSAGPALDEEPSTPEVTEGDDSSYGAPPTEETGKEACEDKDKLCNFWRFSGECENNPKGMKKFCPKACGKC